MPPSLRVLSAQFVDNIGRRKWDVEKARATAEAREKEEKSGQKARLPVATAALKARDYKIDFTSVIGKSVAVSATASMAQRGGFYCETCDCILKDSKAYIDHINGVRDDNRLENLRMADSLQNNFNRGTQRRDKSGFKGVCIKKGSKRWVAQITIDGKRKHLGLFDTAEEAAAAYDAVAKQIHGAFFKPNQIDSRIAA